jgi:hypothetical protein
MPQADIEQAKHTIETHLSEQLDNYPLIVWHNGQSSFFPELLEHRNPHALAGTRSSPSATQYQTPADASNRSGFSQATLLQTQTGHSHQQRLPLMDQTNLPSTNSSQPSPIQSMSFPNLSTPSQIEQTLPIQTTQQSLTQMQLHLPPNQPLPLNRIQSLSLNPPMLNAYWNQNEN